MQIIAHRGASATYPENTMLAFAEAIRAGADMIELDVRRSADGELVVIHDDTVDRTTNGRGAVHGMTLADLRRLDAGLGQRIPTLGDALQLAVPLNVEIKDAGAGAEVLALVGGRVDVLISSFDEVVLHRLRAASLDCQLGYLCRQNAARALRRAMDLGSNSLNVALRATRRRLIDDAHAAGLKFFVYTVDDVSLAKRLLGWGVDGLFTNRPERLSPLLGARRLPSGN